MPVVCSIKNCQENRSAKFRSFFKVPKKERGNKWMEALEGHLKKENISRERIRICQLHFAPSDIETEFITGYMPRRLPKIRPEAVPTIFQIRTYGSKVKKLIPPRSDKDAPNVFEFVAVEDEQIEEALEDPEFILAADEADDIDCKYDTVEENKMVEVHDNAAVEEKKRVEIHDNTAVEEKKMVQIHDNTPVEEKKMVHIHDNTAVEEQKTVEIDHNIESLIIRYSVQSEQQNVETEETEEEAYEPNVLPKYTFQHLYHDLTTSLLPPLNGWRMIFEYNGIVFVNPNPIIPIVANLDNLMNIQIRIMDVSVVQNLSDIITDIDEFSTYMAELSMHKHCAGMGSMEKRRHKQCEQLVHISKERCSVCEKYRTLDKNKLNDTAELILPDVVLPDIKSPIAACKLDDTHDESLPREYTFEHLVEDLTVSSLTVPYGWGIILENKGLLCVNTRPIFPVVAFLDKSMKMNIRTMDVSVLESLPCTITNFGEFSTYMTELFMSNHCRGIDDTETRRHMHCELLVHSLRKRCKFCAKQRTIEQNRRRVIIRRQENDLKVEQQRVNLSMTQKHEETNVFRVTYTKNVSRFETAEERKIEDTEAADLKPHYLFDLLAKDLTLPWSTLSRSWEIKMENNKLRFVNTNRVNPIVVVLDKFMNINIRILDLDVVENLSDSITNFDEFSTYMKKLSIQKQCEGIADMETRRHENCEQLIHASRVRCTVCQKCRSREKSKVRHHRNRNNVKNQGKSNVCPAKTYLDRS